MKKAGSTRHKVQPTRSAAKTRASSRSSPLSKGLGALSVGGAPGMVSHRQLSSPVRVNAVSSLKMSATRQSLPSIQPMGVVGGIGVFGSIKRWFSDDASSLKSSSSSVDAATTTTTSSSSSDVEFSSSGPESDLSSATKLFSRSSAGGNTPEGDFSSAALDIDGSGAAGSGIGGGVSPFSANFNPFANNRSKRGGKHHGSGSGSDDDDDGASTSRALTHPDLSESTFLDVLPKMHKSKIHHVNWDDFEDFGSFAHPDNPEGAYERLTSIFTPTQFGYELLDDKKIRFPRLKPGKEPPQGWFVNDRGECLPLVSTPMDPAKADPDLYRENLHDRMIRHIVERAPNDADITDTKKKALYEVTSTGHHMMYERDPQRVLRNTKMDNVVKDRYLTSNNTDENIDISFDYPNLSPFNKTYRFVNDTPQSHAFLDLPKHKLKFRKQTRPLNAVPGPSMDTTFLSYAYPKASAK